VSNVALLLEELQVQLHSVMQWANLPPAIAQKTEQVFQLFTSKAIERPVRTRYDGLSRINASGLPFQWCFCFGPGLRSVRFLCEAGTPGDSPLERLNYSVGQFEKVLSVLGIPNPDWLWDSVFPYAVPKKDAWPTHWRSAVWFAVGASPKGILTKIYLNLNRDAPLDRWQRVGWMLKSLGNIESLATLCDLSKKVSANSWPVGIAIDVSPNGSPGRVKIYFRSSAVKTDWLHRWYSAANASSEECIVRQLLDAFPLCGKAMYPSKSFIVSLEFHNNRGDISLKTDLGITRWIQNDVSIVQGIRQLLHTINDNQEDLTSALKSIGAWPLSTTEASYCRFVGLGYEPDGSRHLNVYLEPPMKKNVAATPLFHKTIRTKLPTSIRKGVTYLFEKNAENRWTDYSLPVGESDQWVTAYILLQLRYLSIKQMPEYVRTRIRNSLNWLVECRSVAGGWGYNITTENDADATSLAILALRTHNRTIPTEAFQVIRQCQASNGGIATYPLNSTLGGSWTIGVPDITAIALLALGDSVTQSELTAAITFLQSKQSPDGLWPSYWWLTPLYSTFGALSWLSDMHWLQEVPKLSSTLLKYQAVGSFEKALLLLCLLRLGLRNHCTSLVEELLIDQQLGGAWESSAFLRLTDRNVVEPWNTIDAGSTFVDQNAVFTTATVLRALAQYSNGANTITTSSNSRKSRRKPSGSFLGSTIMKVG
jgi:hypothetical protein